VDKIVIEGGQRLEGTLAASGAKNAALPILIATLVAPGEHRLARVPELADTSATLSLLGRIGCPSLVDGDTVRLDTSRIAFSEAPYDVVRKMRASVLVLGPLLARHGEAKVSLPGGCAIGVRPVDQHLKGLEALGARFTIEGGYIHGKAGQLRGAEIVLDMPTVTGTENILTATVLAEGTSVIHNAAREPEVADLARFLVALGARIEGIGTSTLTVHGVARLSPPSRPYAIVADRIEVGTYLAAAAITGGDLTVTGIDPELVRPITAKLAEAGCTVTDGPDDVRVVGPDRPRAVRVRTEPHPGFPTDMQAQVLALSTIAHGTSTITETIFENRFMHVPELVRMGAQVTIRGNTAIVEGADHLAGASVMASDLRASAALVLAGLVARGRTEVLRIYHLDRGYEQLVPRLRQVGARIARVPDDLRDDARIQAALDAS
jgi:UDP-N-acetylglucosamine 1-carboxyvinyltransferase